MEPNRSAGRHLATWLAAATLLLAACSNGGGVEPNDAAEEPVDPTTAVQPVEAGDEASPTAANTPSPLEIVLDALPLTCSGTEVSITSELYRDDWVAVLRDGMRCRYEFTVVNPGTVSATVDSVRFRGLAAIEELEAVSLTPWRDGVEPRFAAVGADLTASAGHTVPANGEIRFELEFTSAEACRTFDQPPIALRPFVGAEVSSDGASTTITELASSLVIRGNALEC